MTNDQCHCLDSVFLSNHSVDEPVGRPTQDPTLLPHAGVAEQLVMTLKSRPPGSFHATKGLRYARTLPRAKTPGF